MWQEKPTAIVMLTNVEEGNKIKCEQYWPGSGKKIYGPFFGDNHRPADPGRLRC